MNQGQNVLDTTHVNREHHLLAKTLQRRSFSNSLSTAHADKSCTTARKARREPSAFSLHPAHGKGPCRPAWLARGSCQKRAGGPLQNFQASNLPAMPHNSPECPRPWPRLGFHIGLLESFLRCEGDGRSPTAGRVVVSTLASDQSCMPFKLASAK